MPEAWAEKAEKAQALIEQIKRDKEAVSSAEDAQKLTAMFQDARSLAAEAGEERKHLEKARLNELLTEYDREKAEDERQKKGHESLRLARPTAQPFAAQGAVSPNMTLRERMKSDSVRMMASTRFVDSMPLLQQAALSEGTVGQGGYLVVPQYMQELFAETRRQGNALRAYGWLNIHPVESNQVYLPRGSGSATVGIVSENTAKPSADQSYTQLAVSIFTAAGISKQSKQLAMDSSPTVLDLSTRELGTLLGNLEEQKIIAGTGSGEPRGILNVAGLAISPSTTDGNPGVLAAGATQQAAIDMLLNAVVAINTNYYAPPSGVLMHPRRLAWLLKAKDTATNYIFNPAGAFRQPTVRPMVDGVTSMSEGTTDPPLSLFGMPLGVSTNIPTNSNFGSAGGSDQDVIIVGAWNEAHWFQRQDVTMDTSDVAGTSWEQNQIWIRAEERFGFSAERYPVAFACVSGKGLSVTNT